MRAALVVLVLAAACGAPRPTGDLAGALAVVGSERLDADTLVRMQTERPSTPARELVQAWVRTTLLAQAATERGLIHEGRTPALVRRLIADWTAHAAIPPVPSAEDIALARGEDWQRFDRGPAVVVHHAVFMKSRNAPPTFAVDAMQLGRTLAAQVDPSWDFARFSAAAKAIPLPAGVELRVEQLPGFVADGRTIEGPSGFDPLFAKQSFALQKPGDSSPPFETRFGVHVVQLESQLPPLRPSDDQVRVEITPDLVARRVRRLQGEALARLQPALPVQLAPTAIEDMTSYVTRRFGQPEGVSASP